MNNFAVWYMCMSAERKIRCAVTFTFLFTSHVDTAVKIMKVWFITIKGHEFSFKNMKQHYGMSFPKTINYYLPSYSSHRRPFEIPHHVCNNNIQTIIHFLIIVQMHQKVTIKLIKL